WRAWRPPRAERPAAGPVAAGLAARDGHPAEGGQAALECHDVWKAFGGIQALRGVSLAVAPGEILGLVGPNGSGKTTLINVASGHYVADRGRIALGTVTLTGRPAHEIASLGIGRTYQIPRPFAHFTALENVALAATFGAARRSPREARAEARAWLEFTGLGRRAGARPDELNLHERKFLELARALAARPRVILLDEVLSGLNPAEVAGAIGLIRAIRDRGVAILFVEHMMRAVLELSDRVVVLNEGEVIAEGSPHDCVRAARVVEVYLGKAHVA
ncbi:MAG: ABC transporter ATP-binding protein, partial [Gemmatimonadales bacterium]